MVNTWHWGFWIAFLLLGQSGCAGLFTEAIVSTPNRLDPWVASVEDLPGSQTVLGIREHFLVPVRGTEPAEIAVSIIEPERIEEPAGTVLVVHGIRAQGLWMRGISHELAEAGYRVALVDLRGHGGSTGETLTFGVQEARDLSQVIDELAARGLLAGQLGVFGYSYGATTSIHLAAIDRRVAAVVATAPFANAKEELPHYIRTIFPGVGHLVPDVTYEAMLAEAGKRGDFAPDEARAEVAIKQVQIPVLLLHGLNDLVVPAENSARLRAANPAVTQLEYIADTGHFGIWLDFAGHVGRRTVNWFDEHLCRVDKPQRASDSAISAFNSKTTDLSH